VWSVEGLEEPSYCFWLQWVVGDVERREGGGVDVVDHVVDVCGELDESVKQVQKP
jgi:hypothetical protein